LSWKETLLSCRKINSTFFNSKEFGTNKEEFVANKEEVDENE